jgi:dTDP-4-amino-4,6-dideoxygalactose transaminase
VPLAFPVVVEGGVRDALREFLRQRDLFCPVHWPASDEQSPRSTGARLAATMLSLPVDQRYDAGQLARLVDAVREFFAGRRVGR